MAKGIGETPAKSPSYVLQSLDYPATREEIVETAAEEEAPIDVINFLKCLPKQRYASYEEALRDFGEADRRFGANYPDERDHGRENLGRGAEAHLGHP